MKSNHFFTLTVVMTLLSSCQRKEADPQVLIDTDLAFSEMSEAQGMSGAFIHYADTSVVMLRNEADPIQGKADLIEAYQGRDDSGFTLTWKPEHAEIAASGELGYTWGKYLISTRDSLGTEQKQAGYYVSVWKKQSDGEWRFVLDGGTSPVPQQ